MRARLRLPLFLFVLAFLGQPAWAEVVVGKVKCGEVVANAEQVRRGMAWVYDRYVTDRSLYALQNDARAAHAGLWADKHPTAPWDWRRQHKH